MSSQHMKYIKQVLLQFYFEVILIHSFFYRNLFQFVYFYILLISYRFQFSSFISQFLSVSIIPFNLSHLFSLRLAIFSSNLFRVYYEVHRSSLHLLYSRHFLYRSFHFTLMPTDSIFFKKKLI